MDELLQRDVYPVLTTIFDSLSVNSLINCYSVSEAFRSNARSAIQRKKLSKKDWRYISRTATFNDQFVDDFQKKLSWPTISTRPDLTEDFLWRHVKDIIWTKALKYRKFSTEFLVKLCSQVLNGSIRLCEDRFWKRISSTQELEEDFIREHEEFLHWETISWYQTLTEEFIREYEDYVNWNACSMILDASENLINEYSNKIDWTYVSQYRGLYVSDIPKVEKWLDWKAIFLYQNYSCKELIYYKRRHPAEWDEAVAAVREGEEAGLTLYTLTIEDLQGKLL